MPSIVINFFSNNQPDPLIIRIDCHKVLHVSGTFFAHHQEFSTVYSALVGFMQVFLNCVRSRLCLEAVIKKLKVFGSSTNNTEA